MCVYVVSEELKVMVKSDECLFMMKVWLLMVVRTWTFRVFVKDDIGLFVVYKVMVVNVVCL